MNYCDVIINSESYGVLFGVRYLEVLKRNNIKITSDENDQENTIKTVFAGIINNCELDGVECDLKYKDVVIWADSKEGFKEFEKAVKCFYDSTIMGKPVKELAGEVKKKKKKRTILGRLFATTV